MKNKNFKEMELQEQIKCCDEYSKNFVKELQEYKNIGILNILNESVCINVENVLPHKHTQYDWDDPRVSVISDKYPAVTRVVKIKHLMFFEK